MLVQNILKSKSDYSVVTVLPGSLVSDAVRILAERKIGSVVVSSDGKIAEGILSERDIVRVLSQQGGAILDQPVDAFMTKKLVTCGCNDSTDSILQQMTDGRFRHMPVVEDGVLVGLITLGDVVKSRLTQLAMEKDALEGMIMGH